jgi:hypothetical protein
MRQKQDVSEDRADGKEGRKQAAKRLPQERNEKCRCGIRSGIR